VVISCADVPSLLVAVKLGFLFSSLAANFFSNDMLHFRRVFLCSLSHDTAACGEFENKTKRYTSNKMAKKMILAIEIKKAAISKFCCDGYS
jgi:hypothetical protein